MNTFTTFAASLCLFASQLVAAQNGSAASSTPEASGAYKIEDIPLPADVFPEIGALTYTPDGQLVVVTRRSGILITRPEGAPVSWKWRKFCPDSLHNPLGIIALSNNSFLVSNMEDLMKITDTDGDGEADLSEVVADDWGLTGNYHETNSIIPDGAGGCYIALGTASHNGPTFQYVRGDYSDLGRRGRNFSAGPWKGWVMHIDAKGKMTPFAKGFRMHNGITRAPDGKLYVGDNQGDWRASSPLYHVQQDHFYGHPASLVWDKDYRKNFGDKPPVFLPWETIEKMRTRAAIDIPYGSMANSLSEPVFITQENFGPFSGQMLIGDNFGQRIARCMLEEVDGVMQGAVTLLVKDHGLRSGNNRLVFSPDGKSIFTGQTIRGWGKPSEGMQRISYDHAPFAVLKMNLNPKGFTFTFTEPLDPAQIKSLTCERYWYKNTHQYGGAKLDPTKIAIQDAVLSADGKTLDISLDGMKTGHNFEFKFGKEFQAKSGAKIDCELIAYTVNKLVPGTVVAAAADKAPAELPAIFNGKDLSGWKIDGGDPACWSVEGGILKVKSNTKQEGSNLWTEKSYQDFAFECEFKFGPGNIDSGVYCREGGMQIQIGISGSLKKDMTASPYIAATGKYPFPAKNIEKLLKMDDWNRLHIECRGRATKVWLNGELVNEFDFPKGKEKGPIGFQLHGSREMQIDYRNIKAQDLEADIKPKEVPALPAIFNGKDFSGWKIVADDPACWSVESGIIKLKSNAKKQGSILWTEKSYQDFAFECEFKFGAGTIDSGIFCREEGMQIQIGISGSLKKDMSASPYIAATGKYPFPAQGVDKLLKKDDWNHLRIECRGRATQVWLNGEKVNEFDFPKGKESGPLGIQLHPGKEMAIDFRNIKAQELAAPGKP